MLKVRKGFFLYFVFATILPLFAEPSVYGNSSSYNTYAPRNKTKTYRRKILQLEQKVAKLKEEIDGLKSIIRGLQKRVNYLSNKTQNNSNTNVSYAEIQALVYRLNRVEKKVDDLKFLALSKPSTIQKPKRKTIALAPKNIALAPKKTKVSKTKSKSKPKQEASSKKTVSDPKANPTKNETKQTSLKSQDLYKKARESFKNKNYAKAKELFNTLLKRGYKKSDVYFMLGEIAFNQGAFSKAIDFYQKSAELKSDSNYMDLLLLHTAIALKKTGQKDQAKEFFKTLIEAYPNSVSATTAKRYLKSMK